MSALIRLGSAAGCQMPAAVSRASASGTGTIELSRTVDVASDSGDQIDVAEQSVSSDVSSTSVIRWAAATLCTGSGDLEVRQRHRDRSCDEDACPHDGDTGRYIGAESTLHSVDTFVRCDAVHGEAT